MLVELRTATLLYLSTEREAGSIGTGKPRAAVVDYLKKTASHASELVSLAPLSDEETPSLGVALSRDVVDMLHKTSLEWTVPLPSPAV
ncbi:MAG: hypothetical protein V4792_15975 [Pseudomonadota bacterium]